jgi:hypothetical protein
MTKLQDLISKTSEKFWQYGNLIIINVCVCVDYVLLLEWDKIIGLMYIKIQRQDDMSMVG